MKEKKGGKEWNGREGEVEAYFSGMGMGRGGKWEMRGERERKGRSLPYQ